MEVLAGIVVWYIIGVLASGFMEWKTSKGEWKDKNVLTVLGMAIFGPFVLLMAVLYVSSEAIAKGSKKVAAYLNEKAPLYSSRKK